MCSNLRRSDIYCLKGLNKTKPPVTQEIIGESYSIESSPKHVILSSPSSFFVIHLLEGPDGATIAALWLFEQILAAMSTVSCDFGRRVSLLRPTQCWPSLQTETRWNDISLLWITDFTSGLLRDRVSSSSYFFNQILHFKPVFIQLHLKKKSISGHEDLLVLSLFFSSRSKHTMKSGFIECFSCCNWRTHRTSFMLGGGSVSPLIREVKAH